MADEKHALPDATSKYGSIVIIYFMLGDRATSIHHTRIRLYLSTLNDEMRLIMLFHPPVTFVILQLKMINISFCIAAQALQLYEILFDSAAHLGFSV